MKTTDVSGFKDFVLSVSSYHVDTRLIGIETVSRLSTDKMHIDGELKITRFNKIKDDHTKGMCVKLPTGDEIFIPASDHPWIEFNRHNFPVYIEDEPELIWNKDLAVEEFYIVINNKGEKKVILISRVNDVLLEYVLCTSRFDRNHYTYFVEPVTSVLKIEDAKNWKFIPVNEIK